MQFFRNSSTVLHSVDIMLPTLPAKPASLSATIWIAVCVCGGGGVQTIVLCAAVFLACHNPKPFEESDPISSGMTPQFFWPTTIPNLLNGLIRLQGNNLPDVW